MLSKKSLLLDKFIDWKRVYIWPCDRQGHFWFCKILNKFHNCIRCSLESAWTPGETGQLRDPDFASHTGCSRKFESLRSWTFWFWGTPPRSLGMTLKDTWLSYFQRSHTIYFCSLPLKTIARFSTQYLFASLWFLDMCVARLCLVLKILLHILHWTSPTGREKWWASKCWRMLPECWVILPQRKQDQAPCSTWPELLEKKASKSASLPTPATQEGSLEYLIKATATKQKVARLKRAKVFSCA